MREVKRRKPLLIKGPMAYEISSHRLADIFAGFMKASLGERPSVRAITLMQATAHLAQRMADRSLPTMLCAFCDYEFARDEQPLEIMVALPWANPKHPPIFSPICPVCAEASANDKTAMAQRSWAKLSPGSRFSVPGHG